jgi:PilZ domain
MATELSPIVTQNSEQRSGNAGSNGSLHVEKRREMRYPTCEPVEVYLLDMNNLRLSGMLKDISKNGMRLELDMPLKAGDRLEVVVQNKAIVFAEVRHCRRMGESYQVGVLIDDVYYPKSTVSKQVTRYMSLEEKPLPSKGVFHQVVDSRHAAETAGSEDHLNRNDIDNLLRLKLSETKATLLERHMMSCDQCLDLLLRELEKRAPCPVSPPKNGGGRI